MTYEKKPYKKQYKATEKKVEFKPKRGNLAPLMSEVAKNAAGIHELSYDFGCRITRLYQYLTEDSNYKEFVISKQIYRSGTSVGARGELAEVYEMTRLHRENLTCHRGGGGKMSDVGCAMSEG